MDPELKAQLDRIDANLAELRAAQDLAAKPILTTAEAMKMANCNSTSAFSRWVVAWGVSNSGNGRWPRHRIDAGLMREARGVAKRRAERKGASTEHKEAA